MSGQIIGMPPWLASPPGQYLLAWERAQLADTVANVFGYHALQLGLPELDALESNRMPHRWLATETPLGDSVAGLPGVPMLQLTPGNQHKRIVWGGQFIGLTLVRMHKLCTAIGRGKTLHEHRGLSRIVAT